MGKKLILTALILAALAEVFLIVNRQGNASQNKNAVITEAAAVSVPEPTATPSPSPSPEPSPTPVPTKAPSQAMLEISIPVVSAQKSTEQLQKNQQTYDEALDLLYTRQFDEARELFLSLGDYKDSAAKAQYCITYPANEPVPEKDIVTEKNLYSVYEHGKVYKIGDIGGEKYTGLVYVPDEVNPQTSFIQYYSGGAGPGDDYLWRPGIKIYFETYAPNAIILFTNEPGTSHMHWRNECQYDLLRQVAKECGTILHDLSSVGSSNGAYTSMMLAADFYINYGIRVKNVCTLDTGCYWQEDYLELSEEEAAAVAEAGTVFYLFEDHYFGEDLKNTPLRRVLDAGIETYAIICYHGNHSVISQNAYSLGVFSFSVDPENTELPTYQYWMTRIDSNTTKEDVNAYSYTEKPESDTRQVF